MKYLILDKNEKRIIHISPTLGYQENGNYLVIDELTGNKTAIPPSICELAEVETVPDGVEPEKWLYEDGEFKKNPNWIDPTQDDVDQILDRIEGRV